MPGRHGGGSSFTLKASSPGQGALDLWTATRATTSDGFGTPVPLTQLNTAHIDWVTWLSADGCRLYGGVNPTNTGGLDDLWLATRPL